MAQNTEMYAQDSVLEPQVDVNTKITTNNKNKQQIVNKNRWTYISTLESKSSFCFFSSGEVSSLPSAVELLGELDSGFGDDSALGDGGAAVSIKNQK